MRSWRLLLIPLATLACAGPLTGATSFSPKYYLSGGAVPPALPSCSGPVDVAVTDGRESPQADVGRRFEEDKPEVVWPIVMRGSAVDYVRDALEGTLTRAGSPGMGQGKSTLQVTLTQLQLQERTFHNAEFSGSIALDLTLSAPGQSTPCWKGKVSGSGTNYGKAGNPENYQETLNRAVEKVSADLFADRTFREALCGKCPGS